MTVADVSGTPFSPQEHAARLARVQEAMARRSLAALVVSDPANLYYLTGYDAWSFYVPQCLVVPAQGQPHLFARAMDAAGAHWTCGLPATHVHGYPEDLVQRQDAHPFDWITRRAVEVGALPSPAAQGDAEVGAELDAHYFSPRAHQALVRGLGSVRVVDSAELVNWVRLVKSPAEQQALRAAGTIAQRVMEVALEGIRPGRRQCDVVAEIMRAQASPAGEEAPGGDYPAIVPMLPTGPRAGTPHLTWTDRRLVLGEATTVEIAGVHQRYHAPLARTISLGAPPARLASCAAAVEEAMAAALDAVTPGASGHDVHAAFQQVLARHDLAKESRIGYSIGIGYPPDWGERTVSLRPGEATELQAGMAFHVIMGIWEDGWGYELSEPVLVTDDGVEQLTRSPRTLLVRG